MGFEPTCASTAQGFSKPSLWTTQPPLQSEILLARLVPEGRVELPRLFRHTVLNRACLPFQHSGELLNYINFTLIICLIIIKFMHTHYRFFHLSHRKKNQPITLLTLIADLRTFLFSFLSLFLPIILYKNFLYLGQSKALLITLLFFTVQTLIHLVSLMPVNFLAGKLGLKMTFILSQIALVVFYFLFVREYTFYSFALLGFSLALWWFSYHIYFVDTGNEKEFGKEIGVIQTVGVLSGILAPFFGGVLLEAFGNSGFFLTAAILTSFTFLMMFFLKPTENVAKVTLDDLYEEIKRRPKDMIAFWGAAAEETIYTIAWPILLFLIFKNLLTIAGISSLIMIAAAVFFYGSGIIVDKLNKEKLQKIGVWAIVSSWLGKSMFQNPLALTFFDGIHKILGCFFIIPLTTIAYNHAKKEREKYIIFREFAYRIGALLALSVFFIIVVLKLPFWTTFIAAALFALLPLIIKT